MKVKFLALVCALTFAISSVALASGLTIKTTPTRAKVGTTVSMLIRGLKPNEKVKGKEYLPFGQTRTVYPRRRANGSGVLLVEVKAQVKGKHRWVWGGRTSHRSGSTKYYVR
jgi:hypothetical protein